MQKQTQARLESQRLRLRNAVEKLQAYAGTAGALAEEADGAVAPLIDATARLHIAVDTANVRIGALADFTEQSKVMSLDVTARE